MTRRKLTFMSNCFELFLKINLQYIFDLAYMPNQGYMTAVQNYFTGNKYPKPL